MASPPSASAPRVQNAAHSPDTVRPGELTDSLGMPVAAPLGDSRVDAVVAAYRAHYRDELARRGSTIAGGVDPVLVALAKRRAAADQGYADPDGWAHLVADLDEDGRFALAERIEGAHRDLGAGPARVPAEVLDPAPAPAGAAAAPSEPRDVAGDRR